MSENKFTPIPNIPETTVVPTVELCVLPLALKMIPMIETARAAIP